MSKLKLTALIPLFLVGCNSPDAYDLFKTTGYTVTETRKIADFDKLDAQANFVFIIYVQDTASKVVLRAGSNLMSEIETSLKNGVLTIADNNRFKFVRNQSRDITAEVYAKNLVKIDLVSSKNISLYINRPNQALSLNLPQCSGDLQATIFTQRLLLTLSESTSRVDIAGSADTLILNSGQSFGPFWLSNLATREATIFHNGSNNMHIYVTDSLNATLAGLGDIYYKGQPRISAKITGRGRLIKE